VDLRLGAAFTRFQTVALQDAFDFGEFAKEDGKGPLISYGPCQFPTLGFIVQRHWEAQAHMPEAMWHVQLSHTAPDGRRADFNWKVRLLLLLLV
jgi:DNA topoisomerase-3